MQISRHWRLNPQRYRLQGVRYTNGDVRLVARGQCPAWNSSVKLKTSPLQSACPSPQVANG